MCGKIIYHGSPLDSVAFFNEIGGPYSVPGSSNPCDHYIYVMQKKVENQREYTNIFLKPYEENILPGIWAVCFNYNPNTIVKFKEIFQKKYSS